jgi:surface polysaccharide O-acyltransferase-like enzyme
VPAEGIITAGGLITVGRRYLAYTRGLAEATPVTRNRVVDFWRALAILVVVFGHWLAASIWLKPDDSIALLNSLEWIPYAGWVTWLVQVMPIFFLAGGYANARGLGKVAAGEERRRDWITTRMRRLFTPVVPLLLFWVLLILVMRTFVPAEVVYAGALSATVPVWFLAVYLVLTAIAPFTHAWWRRHGPPTVLALAALSVAVDVARFTFEVPGIGWVNFVFVWACVHQVGYWWSDRDDAGIPSRVGWACAAGALAALVAVTWVGWYPVAMVGIPGAGVTNMTPPTFAIAILGIVQFGVIIGTQPALRRRMQRIGTWHRVVSFNGVIMTVYLWHLTAMSLVAAAGLSIFDGRMFRIEPGTTQWWVTRPVWLAILILAVAPLVALFAVFEWRINRQPGPRSRTAVTAGVLLVAGSAAATAQIGITTPDAIVQWTIPVAAIAGAIVLGALPARRRRD